MGFFKQYGEQLRDLQEQAALIGKELDFFAAYWSVKEVAAFLGISESAVEKGKAGTDRIPRYRFGAHGKRLLVRFKPGEVVAFREAAERKSTRHLQMAG